MIIENNIISAAEGKFIHRKGDNAYYRSAYLHSSDTMDDFEEVNSIPEEKDLKPYSERVQERIQDEMHLSLADEIAIIRQKDSKPDEFKIYYEKVEQIKQEEKLK